MANSEIVDKRITIIGYKVGALWWPIGEKAWKEFSYDLTAEDARLSDGPGSLRYHVLNLTSDGDFVGGCDLAEAELTITINKRDRSVSRSFDLTRFPSVADCVIDDWEGF